MATVTMPTDLRTHNPLLESQFPKDQMWRNFVYSTKLMLGFQLIFSLAAHVGAHARRSWPRASELPLPGGRLHLGLPAEVWDGGPRQKGTALHQENLRKVRRRFSGKDVKLFGHAFFRSLLFKLRPHTTWYWSDPDTLYQIHKTSLLVRKGREGLWKAKEVWWFWSWYQESIRFGSAISCVWPKLQTPSLKNGT